MDMWFLQTTVLNMFLVISNQPLMSRIKYKYYLMNTSYYMAGSTSGQYVANSVFWLTNWAGKVERYCTPGTARFVPAKKKIAKVQASPQKFSLAEITFC